MNDVDLVAARDLAAEALALVKAELNLPPARVVEPNASALLDAVEQLDKYLVTWADRGTSDDLPGATRQAATDAVTVLDFLSAQAYRVRERLIGQMRVYDDASAARANALLARLRGTEGDSVDG